MTVSSFAILITPSADRRNLPKTEIDVYIIQPRLTSLGIFFIE